MPGTGKVGELKLGMTVKELDMLLGNNYQPYELAEPGVRYRFYREQGVAVRIVSEKVTELVVVGNDRVSGGSSALSMKSALLGVQTAGNSLENEQYWK
jgi:hypothetical protein